MKLYHVTPAENIVNRFSFKVDPAFSKGKIQRSWWVDADRLNWALAHCSARHQVDVRKLEIVMINADVDVWKFKRTRWPGVYTTDEIMTPARIVEAVRWLNTNDDLPATTQEPDEEAHRVWWE